MATDEEEEEEEEEKEHDLYVNQPERGRTCNLR